jgi:hypothetical protein
MASMKNSFHIGGFKVFDGFGKVFVHCLEGNQNFGMLVLQWLCWGGFFREGLDTYGVNAICAIT